MQADENFRNWYFNNARDTSPDARWARDFGEVKLVPPIIAVTWAITEYHAAMQPTRDCHFLETVRHWSRQNTRAFLTAAVPAYGLQWLTGASRPGENPSKGSSWQPFDDNNGVSGRTVINAIPFLVAAKMTDKPLLKTALYFGSTLVGYSRIHYDAHFLSQVLMGYAIAYIAVEATEMTNHSGFGCRVVPLTLAGSYSLGVERRW